MKNDFFFQLDNRLYAGIGKTREIADLITGQGWKALTILVDEGVSKSSVYYTEIKKIIEDVADSVVEIELRGSEEPSYDYLDEIAERIRAQDQLDAMIAIGGGSALDSAKALACLRTNPGPGINYRGFDQVKVPPVPSVCIPTTAGTGSEVTINAVFTDKSEMKKLGINGKFLNATYAILDAKWLESCPQAIQISAGMDAMVHTLESFMTTNANVLTRAFNREAFSFLYKNLPALKTDPANLEAKQNLLLGAYLAAAGLFNSGSGIAGGLSYPLGVHYKVPHGIGGGIFIASVVEYNVERGYTDYAELLDMVEQHPDWTSAQKATRFAQALRELSQTLEVPETLCKWGVNRGNVEQVAALMHPLQAAFNQNPIPFSAESDALNILRRHTA